MAVPNRSDFGEISYRDWYSPGGFEFGYLAPDPLDADIVFAGGWYRTVVRFDRRTGQIAHVFVPGTKIPLREQRADVLLAAGSAHALLRHAVPDEDDRCRHDVAEISPDLTDVPAPPPTPAAAAPQSPSITTFSLSTVKAGVIWAGDEQRHRADDRRRRRDLEERVAA